jgi:SPP1 family predicted phage head-tail adaptor
MATMDPGKLNRRVTIQSLDAGVDALGQPLGTWSTVAQVWASIINKSGLQAIKADQPVSIVQSSIRIRYRSDVTASMRVVHGATVYEIAAVLPDVAGRQWTDLVCQVVPA